MDLGTAQDFSHDGTEASSEDDWMTFLTNPGYTLVAGMVCGLVVNFLSRQMPRGAGGAARNLDFPSNPLSSMSDFLKNSKMVLVVRTDLGMQKGKAAAQCAHAALGCYKKAVKNNSNALSAWEKTGQAKVCLKIDSEESMLNLAAKAREAGLTWTIVRDAGRTQVEAGSMTVLGIGPAAVEDIDKITGHLKLY